MSMIGQHFSHTLYFYIRLSFSISFTFLHPANFFCYSPLIYPIYIHFTIVCNSHELLWRIFFCRVILLYYHSIHQHTPFFRLIDMIPSPKKLERKKKENISSYRKNIFCDIPSIIDSFRLFKSPNSSGQGQQKIWWFLEANWMTSLEAPKNFEIHYNELNIIIL